MIMYNRPSGPGASGVRAVLANLACEFQQRLDAIDLPVLVRVGKPIQRGAFGPVADRIHLAADRQQALAVFQFRPQ